VRWLEPQAKTDVCPAGGDDLFGGAVVHGGGRAAGRDTVRIDGLAFYLLGIERDRLVGDLRSRPADPTAQPGPLLLGGPPLRGIALLQPRQVEHQRRDAGEGLVRGAAARQAGVREARPGRAPGGQALLERLDDAGRDSLRERKVLHGGCVRMAACSTTNGPAGYAVALVGGHRGGGRPWYS